jgi:hypothetical protein
METEVDPYSSGSTFAGWRGSFAISPESEPLPVARPHTWLLAVGWLRHGKIGFREVPGRA